MPQRHVLMSSMKDEGPFVLEFIAHHRVLGFDGIYIATNDCNDGTDLLLDVLAGHGIITHVRNLLGPGEMPQHRGYLRIRRRHDIQSADWIMVLDADEFLVVDRGNHRVSDLTELAGPEVHLITLNAMNFGTSSDMLWKPGRVTTQFIKRLAVNNRLNGPVKSLSRGHGLWRSMHNHHPVGFGGEGDICHMRGNGQTGRVPDDDKLWRHLRFFKPDQMTHEIAWFNHYPIKSIDSYMLRQMRGRGVTRVGEEPVIRHDEDYWIKFAGAREVDTRIQDFYGSETEAEMNRLLALPDVAEAQAHVEALYAVQIAAITDDLEL
ncbi:MAG: glycosyltransferase family 2 protein [Paracoccus sp. (in: a-proteobacteria)]